MISLWCIVALILSPATLGVASVHAGAGRTVAHLLISKLVAVGLAMWGLALSLFLATLIAIPLATVGFVAGYFAGQLCEAKSRSLYFAAIICWSGAAIFAHFLPAIERTEIVTTSKVVTATRTQAWDRIKAFGALHTKPFGLLRFGLPVPVRCALDEEALHAHRTCYFDQGQIEQRVTRWQPPERMELAVIGSNLPFRPLEFTAATYTLTEHGTQTTIARSTSFRTRLQPAWFWRPLERQTVAAEHDYLLQDLADRF